MATETGDFAELVRGLKERSGLSYGALAKKLHVSTSTLHRYCNGDAVPTEFAPVERLGRLCGATREELIALHRSWIVADDARRRRALPEPAAPAAAPAVSPAEGTDDGAAAAAATAAAVARADAAEPVAPVERVERVERVEPAEPAGTGESAEPVASAGPGEPAAPVEPVASGGTVPEAVEPGKDPAETLVTVRAPSTTAPRSRKRLRIALAAAAVVALAVPVAYGIGRSDSAQPTGDTGKGGRAAAGPSTAPGVSVSPSGSPSTASPSASTSPASAEPSGASATPSRTKATSAPGGKVTGTPVRAGVSSYNWTGPCGQHYLLDRRPDQVPPPPNPEQSRRWAASFDGVDAGHMYLELTATGRTDAAVVITGLHVRVVERGEPLDRTAYSMGEGCGGGVTPQTFDIDLDAAHPAARPIAGQDGDRTVPAKDFPFKVSTSDPQVFNLDVHTEGHVVTWYLELEWSDGERHGKVVVDDGGKPFRTSAMEGEKRYGYQYDTDEWALLE
ncbi:helix-turn-helix domain-containing protein [Streptomyces sp. NPDC096030]|uniref:helix-turn-helix domain-containing protein n=1 Tax=Streptomyces sp. NPDC096030 TaxID=3155423 RepID=UPI00332F3396